MPLDSVLEVLGSPPEVDLDSVLLEVNLGSVLTSVLGIQYLYPRDDTVLNSVLGSVLDFQPVPPKVTNLSARAGRFQRVINCIALNRATDRILAPL